MCLCTYTCVLDLRVLCRCRHYYSVWLNVYRRTVLLVICMHICLVYVCNTLMCLYSTNIMYRQNSLKEHLSKFLNEISASHHLNQDSFYFLQQHQQQELQISRIYKWNIKYNIINFSYSFAAHAGDAASEGGATSYYSEYDPFDYLYSTSTQYSDPVYEAVNKIDRSPLSPGLYFASTNELCNNKSESIQFRSTVNWLEYSSACHAIIVKCSAIGNGPSTIAATKYHRYKWFKIWSSQHNFGRTAAAPFVWRTTKSVNEIVRKCGDT